MEEENKREEGMEIEGEEGEKFELWSVSHKFLIHQSYDKCYTCFYL